jgi:hypothetical protein
VEHGIMLKHCGRIQDLRHGESKKRPRYLPPLTGLIDGIVVPLHWRWRQYRIVGYDPSARSSFREPLRQREEDGHWCSGI